MGPIGCAETSVINYHYSLCNDLGERSSHISQRNEVHALSESCVWFLRGGADKTLARPGKKQATATKLGIYSTYNSKSCSDDWHRWRFWSAFRHFGTHFAESFRMSKSSWTVDPTRSREMPSYSAIDLAEIRRSSKISSCIWSITFRGGHCFGSSRARRITGGKITTFKLDHPFFDGDIRWCMFP